MVGVGACDVGTPVSPGVFVRAPDADFFVAFAGGVDVEAGWRLGLALGGEEVWEGLTARLFHTSSLGLGR